MCIPSSHARSFALAGWYQAFAATCLVARLWHFFAIACLLLGLGLLATNGSVGANMFLFEKVDGQWVALTGSAVNKKDIKALMWYRRT